MAASADVVVHEQLGDFATYPVLAATTIYEGTALSVDADGYANPLQVDEIFIGFARAKADNSAGADAAINVEVRRGEHTRELPMSGAALADAGDAIYASDDATFTKTSTSNLFIGHIECYSRSGYHMVRVKPFGNVLA